MKRIAVVIGLLLIAGQAYAADFTGMGTFKPDSSVFSGTFGNGASFGYLKSGTAETAVARYTPDFKLGDLGIGLDINVPIGGADKPTNIDTVVLRYAEYKTPAWGLRYGVLTNVTLGYGLIMNNYTSTVRGSLMQTNLQTGLRGYFNSGMYGLEYLGTWSNLYAVRLTEKLDGGLMFGQTYITDSNGVNFTRTDGTQVTYPAQAAVGIDAGYPLWSGTVFAEAGHQVNHGSGLSAGYNLDQNLGIGTVNFKAEYRYIDKNFIPGYFNEDYETNPIDFASYEAANTSKNGYRVQLGANVLGQGSALAVLEGYQGSNTSLRAEAIAQLSKDYSAWVQYYQPNFVDARSLDLSQGAVITGKLGYKVNPYTMVIINYKKAYDPVQGKVVETQWYELSLNF